MIPYGNLNFLVIFAFVLARLLGIAIGVPQVIAAPASWRTRLAAVVVGSLMLSSGLADDSSLQAITPVAFVLTWIRELSVGVAMGLALRLIISGWHISSEVASQMSGLALAATPDETGETSPPLAKLVDLIAVATFLASGGHRAIVQGLLDSYRWMPPGQSVVSADFVTVATSLLSQSYQFGVQASLPLLAALLVSTVVLGLIGRVIPQMSVFMIGSGVQTLVVLAAFFCCLGSTVWMFQAPIVDMVQQLPQLFK